MQSTTRSFDPNATIVLVGSRGSGKRSLGFIGATHLGRRLITEDHYFEEITGLSRRGFLSKYGNKEFCRRNVDVLQKMLENNRTGCIIECGMGSLARGAQESLRKYSREHPVIYVLRNSDRIRKLLKLSETEARRLEQADSIHRGCSNFEFYNLHDPSCERHMGETSQDRASPNYSSGLKDAKQDFSNFLDFVTGYGLRRSAFESPFSLAAVPAERRPYTFALQMRLSDFLQRDIDLAQLNSGGGDVVELRIDVAVPNMLSDIAKKVALIRRWIGVPIVFHVEKGIAPDPNFSDTLLHHALRLGVEYVIVNLECREDSIRQLIDAKGGSKIIGHYMNPQLHSASWCDDTMMAMYQRAAWLGCDIVRLLQVASSRKDNDDVRSFIEKISAILTPHPLLIAYNLGTLGHTSLVSNPIFTPVTHNAIVSKHGAQDFLITAQEAMQALYQTSVLDPLHFYIYGATVSYSLSPAMHNTAYRVCGMSHDMQIRQASSLDELHRLSQDPHFGGAGVAQPFKVGIMSHLHGQSHHATAIGAVNTLLPLRAIPDGSPQFILSQALQRNKAGPVCAWYGDNTDWIGIMTCLRRNVSPRNVVQPSKTTGLVIGAGGMARAAIYAMIQLGCRKIFIYNRTIDHAEIVARHFNSWAGALTDSGQVVVVLRSLEEQWPAGYNPATLMVSCVPAHSVGSRPGADFKMPLQWLGSPTGGVVIEVCLFPLSFMCANGIQLAYKPRLTPLIKQLDMLRQTQAITQAWVAVDGREFIPAQGIAQFELMTGRKAPKGRMRKEVIDRLIFEEGMIRGLLVEKEKQREIEMDSWGGHDAL
jgi:3-dehydroquinate dehydratase type I